MPEEQDQLEPQHKSHGDALRARERESEKPTSREGWAPVFIARAPTSLGREEVSVLHMQCLGAQGAGAFVHVLGESPAEHSDSLRLGGLAVKAAQAWLLSQEGAATRRLSIERSVVLGASCQFVGQCPKFSRIWRLRKGYIGMVGINVSSNEDSMKRRRQECSSQASFGNLCLLSAVCVRVQCHNALRIKPTQPF